MVAEICSEFCEIFKLITSVYKWSFFLIAHKTVLTDNFYLWQWVTVWEMGINENAACSFGLF